MRIEKSDSPKLNLDGRLTRPHLNIGHPGEVGHEKTSPQLRNHINFFPMEQVTVPSGAYNGRFLQTGTFPEKNLVFKPYVYSCPGKSEITFKGKKDRGSEDFYAEVIYDPGKVPNVSDKTRAKIKLPGISKTILAKAKTVAAELAKEWEAAEQLRVNFQAAQSAYKEELTRAVSPNTGVKGGRLKKRYLQTEEKDQLRKLCDEARDACRDHPFGSPYKKISTTSNENFLVAYGMVLDRLIGIDGIDSKLREDKSFEALVTFLCQKTKRNKAGFLSAMPSGFFSFDDPDLMLKARTLGRYSLVNLLKIDTAEKAERYNEFSKQCPKIGVQYLSTILTFTDLLKVSFPGYLDGGNPPIREWLVSATNKWQAESSELYRVKLLATKAVKNVFQEQEVVDSDGVVDVQKLLEVDWGITYHNALKGAIGICPFTMSFFDALELAVPGIFEVVPKFKFKYPDKWTGESALSTIDVITRRVAEDNLNLVGADGKFDVERARDVEDWGGQFNAELSGCVGRSGVGTVYDALKRVYPSNFGWGLDQISPGEIRFNGMWDKKPGKRLFQLRFAKSIYALFEKNKKEKREGFENHTVTFNPSSDYPLSMSKSDLNLLISYFISERTGWREFVSKNKLTAGLKDAASGDFETAFILLFGKVNKINSRLGSTELTLGDLYLRSQNRTTLVTKMTDELPSLLYPSGLKLKIIGFGDQEGYKDEVPTITGIEQTCLEPLLEERPLSKVPERVQILYDALAASILPFPTLDEGSSSRVKERGVALEKILVSAFPRSDGGNLTPVLSDPRLKILLSTVSAEIIPNLNFGDKLKAELQTLIEELMSLRNSSVNNCREVLLQACKADKGEKPSLVSVLNEVFEKLFESMSIYEIRRNKIYGSSSSQFERVYLMAMEETSEVDEEVVEEEVAESDESDSVDESENPDEEVLSLEETVDPFGNPVIEEDDDYVNFSKISVEDVVEVCAGRKDEEPVLRSLLIDCLKKPLLRRELIHNLKGGDLLIQIRFLTQLSDRLNKRSPGRFNYITCRLNTPEYIGLDSILGIESMASEDVEAVLPSIISEADLQAVLQGAVRESAVELEVQDPIVGDPLPAEETVSLSEDSNFNIGKIDKELLEFMPPWWPMKNGFPLAIPVLYWNNVLNVALPEEKDLSALREIKRRFSIAEVKSFILPKSKWRDLSAYFKAHARTYNPNNVTLLRPFLPEQDQEIMLENIAYLRNALIDLANKMRKPTN